MWFKNLSKDKDKIYTILVILLLFTGIFVRIYDISSAPGGINQDEAYSGYEAYSMLKYGTDSWGYSFPVYLHTWGAGMSALNSYLIMPFIALLGDGETLTLATRLPQAIVASFSVLVFFLLLKKIYDKKIALLGLFFIVICPYHILMARWGLDCNLAPGFLLFGLYFFILGVDKPKYYMLSALFYGLTLYTYAAIWSMLPIILILQVLYLIYLKKLKWNKFIFLGILIFAVFAVPLLLFVAVNMGYLDEIRTPLISIPKLVAMRTSDISFEQFGEKISTLFKVITEQNDGLYWNCTKEYGLYYKFSMPFAILGFLYCMKNTITAIKNREYSKEVFIIIWFFASVVQGCLTFININRINSIHFSIIIFCVLGIFHTIRFLKNDFKFIKYVIIAVYLISFINFEKFYFTEYNEGISRTFQSGLGEAVEYAESSAGDDIIYVSSEYMHPKILFYSKFPTPEYIESVNFDNYTGQVMNAVSFGKYRLKINAGAPPEESGIYIIGSGLADQYSGFGYNVKTFDYVSVAVKKN